MMVCVVSRCGKAPLSSQRGMNSFGIGSTSINREGAALRRLILEFVSSFLHHIPLIKFLHKGCVKIFVPLNSTSLLPRTRIDAEVVRLQHNRLLLCFIPVPNAMFPPETPILLSSVGKSNGIIALKPRQSTTWIDTRIV